MANLDETAQWHENIYQLALADKVKGGPDGAANKQPKQLADRTQYLKGFADEVAEARGEAPSLSARLADLEELIGEGSADAYEFYNTFAYLPTPGVNGVKCVTLDTGFIYVWEDTQYTARFASAANFPNTGIVGVVYIAKNTGHRYFWTGTAYAINLPTFGDFPLEGQAGITYHAVDTGIDYTWNVSSQMYTTTYAAYAALPASGETTVLYVVTADNLTYTWNGTANRYETQYPNFAALPGTGIAGRNYVTNDNGRLYTWETDKYGAHYAGFSAFPATGTEDRYWIDDSAGYTYEWWSGKSAYAIHFDNLSAFPNPGIAGVIYVDDSTRQSYAYDGSEYAPAEGGSGVLGNGDNTTISEENLLTVLGVSTVAEAIDELHRRLNNEISGNAYLGGLKLGMYLDLPSLNDGDTSLTYNDTYQNLRIRISGFNHYKNTQNTWNHIVFEFKHIPIKKQMRTNNTNDGGYPKSTGTVVLKPYLEDGFLTGLKAALGITSGKTDYIRPVRRNVTQGQNGAWTKTAFDAAIFLPCEKEVFGTNKNGDATTEEDLTQLPIYAQGQTRLKNHNGSAITWWDGSPCDGSTAYFCYVGTTGNSGYNSAGFENGCSPCFPLS